MLLRLRLRLALRNTEDGWVLADVVDERCEGWVAEKSLDQATVAFILLSECYVLAAEVVLLLCLDGDFAFELTDVFCEIVSTM